MDKKIYILGGILTVLLILAGVLFFSSGSTTKKTPSGQVNLIWWKTFEDSENVQDLISDYEAGHKNVTITYAKKDSTEYEQQLLNAIAAGNGPDIFSIHNDWLPTHMDKMIPAPPSIISLRTYKDSFADVASDDFVSNTQIYAVPLAVDDLVLYYNKDILNSAGVLPPKTWPELVSDVLKITKVASPGTFNRSAIALGTSNNVNRAVDILTLMMMQNGTKFYTDDLRSATFDQTQSYKANDGTTSSFNPGQLALDVYTQFANPAKASYTWNSKSDLSIDAFTQGKVAMMLGYSYMEPTIIAKAPNLNWDVAPVPQISVDADKIDFANYWGEGVSKASKNSDTAWDFLNFISSAQELNKYYAKHKLVSSRKDLLAQQAADPQVGVFAESALGARSVYKKDPNVYEAVFVKMIDDVILNNETSSQALSNAMAQINLSLQKQQ